MIGWPEYVRQPDEAGFLRVFEETKGVVFTICLRVLRNQDDALDAVQGTYGRLLALLKEPPPGIAEREPKALLSRLAWLEADRLRQSRRRRQQREINMEEYPSFKDGGDDPREVAASLEASRLVGEQVDRLGEMYRLPIQMHYFHGMTHREIGEMLGLPDNTITTRIKRGLKKLRPMLKRIGIDGSPVVILGTLASSAAFLAPPQQLTAQTVYVGASALAANLSAGAALQGVSSAAGGVVLAKAKIAGALIAAAAVIAVVLVGTGVLKNPAGLQDRNWEPARRNTDQSTVLPPAVPTDPTSRRSHGGGDLEEGRKEFTVRVTDTEGKPLPKAFVTVVGDGGIGAARGETNAEGVALLPLSTDAAAIEITATLGNRRGVLKLTPQAPPDATIQLDARPVVVGKVLDEAGAPIKGARVAVHSGGKEKAAAESSDDGLFRIVLPGAGTVELAAQPPKGSDFLAAGPVIVYTQPAEDVVIPSIVLSTSEALDGVVTNTEGAPIAGAKVTAVLNKTVPLQSSVLSDEAGRYRLTGIPIGLRIPLLSVSHPDYCPRERRYVSPYDGPQDFVLEHDTKVTLSVRDGVSGAAIPDYRFRVLRMTPTGYNPVPHYRDERVSNPAGEVVLGQLDAKEIRVEVIAGFDSADSQRRGAAVMQLPGGGKKPARVEVQLGDARCLRGIVVDRAGRPVPGASVSFRPMVDALTQVDFPAQAGFDPKPVLSGSNGGFELKGLFPGECLVRVSRDGMASPHPLPVVVPSNTDVEGVRLQIGELAKVSGAVTSAGRPAARRLVYLEKLVGPDAPALREIRGWAVYTDATGTFQFEGLLPGRYKASVGRAYQAHEGDIVEFVLAEGEQKQLSFGIPDGVRLSGKITFSGTRPKMVSFFLLPHEGGARIPITLLPDDSYEVLVPPGRYQVTATNWLTDFFWVNLIDEMSGGLIGEVEIGREPGEQTRDFNVEFSSATIVCDMGPQRPTVFPPGSIEISQKLGGTVRHRLLDWPVTSRTAEINPLVPGLYKVTFRSKDGAWIGESEWTEVRGGAENFVVVFLRKPERIRLGGWNPDLVRGENVELNYSLGDRVLPPGAHQVLMDFEGGYDGVAAVDVSLIDQQGNVLARDAHPSWLGAREVGNVYRLELPESASGAGLSLRVRLKADAVKTDTFGSVFLIKN